MKLRSAGDSPRTCGMGASGERPTASESPKRSRSRRWAGRLAELVFSGEKRVAEQVRFGLSGALVHLTWAAIYVYTAGLQQMSVGAMHLMIATKLVGTIGFYSCVRLGWTRRMRDSGLVAPQMLWSSFSAVLGYALAPTLRLPLLQMLCLIPIYGFFHLQPRQLVLAGGGSVAMLSTVLTLGTCGFLPRFDAGQEMYPALLTASVMIGITWITVDHSARRGRMQKQKLELNAAVAAVRDLVIRDTLTDLFNRRHMQDLLREERARAVETGRRFAVALMDLDHFKRINDTHGHGTGDDVLRRFAELASLSIRQNDTVARWGGEEFLVLMPETVAMPEARAPLDRLRSELEQEAAASLLSRIGLTFSAGIAVHRVDESVEQVVARADRALYAAKAAGRNRLSVDTEMPLDSLYG